MRLKLIVSTRIDSDVSKIELTFPNEIGKEKVIEILIPAFEIELLSSEISESKKETTISFLCTCQDKILKLKRNMNKVLMSLGNVPKFSDN